MNTNWEGIKSLTISRRNLVLWAVIAFIVYVGSVVAGSMLQKTLGLKLQMGWGQQIVSMIIVLVFASFFKKPKELLGLSVPKQSKWLLISIIAALFVITVYVIVRIFMDEPAELGSLEYYIYEATMPGLGEELGLRGLVFGFLLYYAKQHNFSSKGIWILMIIQALPFGILHILQSSGTEAIVIFTYTSFVAIVLAWLRAKTNSILPCIIAHNIINTFAGLSYYLLMK